MKRGITSLSETVPFPSHKTLENFVNFTNDKNILLKNKGQRVNVLVTLDAEPGNYYVRSFTYGASPSGLTEELEANVAVLNYE